jgi:DNA-binding transcriptional MerR regulator
MSHFQAARPAPARPASPSDFMRPGLDGRRTFAIGEIARDFGVTLRALRFYEAKGMLKPRRRGTTRYFTLSDRERLATILRGKELGFSLRQISEMIAAGNSGPQQAPLPLSVARISDQITVLEMQKAAIEHALASLRDHASTIASGEAESGPAATVASSIAAHHG